MADRPVGTRTVPEGHELVAVPDPAWRLVNGKVCRRGFGRGKPACREPAVAELDRQHWRGGRQKPNWWAYCPAHLYGRWIENGNVMHWILRAKENPDG